MKKEIADQWVAALRSGKYHQTTCVLHDDEHHFCCLGVLCDISKIGRWEKHPKLGYRCYKVGFEEWLNQLPPSVIKWSEMTTGYGFFHPPFRSETSLAALNDAGKSFQEIADIIEDNWEKL